MGDDERNGPRRSKSILKPSNAAHEGSSDGITQPHRPPPSSPGASMQDMDQLTGIPASPRRGVHIDLPAPLPSPSRPPVSEAPQEEAASPRGTSQLRRQRSLIRPGRSRARSRGTTVGAAARRRRAALFDDGDEEEVVEEEGCCSSCHWWTLCSRCLTCWAFGSCLKACGKRDALMQQAWREKMALCMIIAFFCLLLGFITFGFTTVVCRPAPFVYRRSEATGKNSTTQRWFIVHGQLYNIPEAYLPYPHPDSPADPLAVFAGEDITVFFPYAPTCVAIGLREAPFQCAVPGLPFNHCHKIETLAKQDRVGQVVWDWADIEGSSTRFAYNGFVLDVGYYMDQVDPSWPPLRMPYGPVVDAIFRASVGGDATKAMLELDPQLISCLIEMFGAGTLDVKSIGCIFTDIVLYTSLVVILAVVLIKFALAVFFTFTLSRKLGHFEKDYVAVSLRPNQNGSSNGDGAGGMVRTDTESGAPPMSHSRTPSQANANAGGMQRGRRPSQQDLLERGEMSNVGANLSASASLPALPSLSAGNTQQSGSKWFNSRYATAQQPRHYNPEEGKLAAAPLPRSGSMGSLPPLPASLAMLGERQGSLKGGAASNTSLRTLIPATMEAKGGAGDDPYGFKAQAQHALGMYSLLVVTCYSEGEAGLKATIDSLVATDYPDTQKMLFIVADGLITGSGNEKSTPQILVDLMEIDPLAGTVYDGIPWNRLAHFNPAEEANESDVEPCTMLPDGRPWPSLAAKPNEGKGLRNYIRPGQPGWLPDAHSYVAIADGTKRHNMARVFAGHYVSGGHRVPALVVVKCGPPGEAAAPKPGNRGKRDSQIILMSWLSKLLFDDRLTPLEYDMAIKARHLMAGRPATVFETVLMVDADTTVYASSLRHMNAVMALDPGVMGLCGETKIANKAASWVTAIQVFEYFISHHLNKAFESVFGGVTCLPGCFCMYRIKAPKGRGLWVPVLASPDILDMYAENVTDTLHKKNLLLLGEDRYLTTLMLRTFPKRAMMFVPAAACKTVVPDTFRVLLSQRRRWINSTVHNLFELVLVRDLCGTFCCSMQFVIFMELVGTLVLPAAIVFTGVLLVSSFLTTPQVIPLALLAAILGLPAFLILFTARSPTYIIWLLCYLLALPIWNFVLPVYAYWHFDDFSWGETRKVQAQLDQDGKKVKPATHAGGHGDKEGTFDSSAIYMRRWLEFDLEAKKGLSAYLAAAQGNAPSDAASSPGITPALIDRPAAPFS